MAAGPFQNVLEDLHRRFAGLQDGEVATYIPELGKANPEHFAIAVATTEGHVYSVGDASVPFTIQSISKPLVYGLALDDRGVEVVMNKVGVEPSGEAFNAISLEPDTGRPRNPMINAGAITVSSLVYGGSSREKLARMLDMLRRYASHPVTIDEEVCRSERLTGHRNRAIGHLLRNAEIIDGGVDSVLDFYFRQCSALVSCEDLAVMAATLANGGINPISGDQAVGAINVDRILSVMSTCGMYDFAGSWTYQVGLPAKSGVSGGILAVLPGQLGIGVFSPRLDRFGNSVRGVAVCQALSSEFGLHVLKPPISPASVVRSVHTLADAGSKRQRTAAELAVLATEGKQVRILELQGALGFSSVEIVFRQAAPRVGETRTLIFDMRRVDGVEASVPHLFSVFVREVTPQVEVLITHLTPGHPLRMRVEDELGTVSPVRFMLTTDLALEYCEDRILTAQGTALVAGRGELPLADQPLLRTLSGSDIAALQEIVERRTYTAGDTVVAQGGESDEVFLIVSGLVSVNLPLNGGGAYRVATLGAGTTFGEMALIDRGPRAADVSCETDLVCYVFSASAVDVLPQSGQLKLRLFEALARDLAARLRRANAEIQALAG